MPVAAAEPSLGERVRQGDAAAFETLYRDYAAGIYDFLVRLVHDRAAAEDLTQTTFIKAFEHRSTLRDPEKVRCWLWATAHNQALNHLARQRKSDPLDEQFDLATLARGPEETVEAKDAAELVWLAAASLEPRQYTVLDLTVRRDLSTQEVAEALGVPVGHAAVLVNRAREALGHAVRYLLVARRREKCPQLAALVPAGVRALTSEQRSTVDHHMRRCERCRELGDRLTAPAELLGTFILLPFPPHLQKVDISHLLAARAGKAGPLKHHATRAAKARRLARQSAQGAAHQAVTVLQVMVTVAVAVAVTVPQSGSTASPKSPAVLAAAKTLAASKTGANPTAAPASSSTGPTLGTSASTAASESLIAIVDPPPNPYTPFGFSSQSTTVRLLRPNGTQVNTLTLKSGIRFLAATGPRIFLLEPGGVLRGVRTDGTVEDLGSLGTDLNKLEAPFHFVASPDGQQWLWGMLDSGAVDFAPTPTAPMHTSMHLGGIGLPARIVERAAEPNHVLEPWGWSSAGPIIGDRLVCCGLGGGPLAFGEPYLGRLQYLDLNSGTTRSITVPGNCSPWGYAADGTFSCYTWQNGPLAITLTSGRTLSANLPSWVWQAGDAYLSPDGHTLAVGLVGEPGGLGPLTFSRYETYLVDTAAGSVKPLALSGVLPALWGQPSVSSWLPDGSLMVIRQAGAPGGDPGTYLVSPTGTVVKMSSLGPPIGVLTTVPGYATAAEAAQAAADAFLKKTAANAPPGTGSGATSGCGVHLGTPTFGVDAAYFAGDVGCTGGGGGAGLFTYVFKDSAGWHYLDARGAQAGFIPGIGLQGTLSVSSCVKVRATPGLSGQRLSCLASGATVKVDGGPNYVDGKMWWHLQGLGWMAHDFLICAGYDAAAGLLTQQC